MTTASEVTTETVRVPAGRVELLGDLVLPAGARGVVLFAHGSGSSRRSPRNRYVAQALQERGLGTLLLDLLTVGEERTDAVTGSLRFDVGLLSRRLSAVSDWLGTDPRTAALPLGLFGASTGAAAALTCAAQTPDRVAAVVSRGGRPDLAGASTLGKVRAPVLLIVGGADDLVLQLNEAALRALGGPKRLSVVPGATHLFEEPGALEHVARLAGDWLASHLVRPAPPRAAPGA
jgi:alpha-beta hydrolase superfamily lysophospholipase